MIIDYTDEQKRCFIPLPPPATWTTDVPCAHYGAGALNVCLWNLFGANSFFMQGHSPHKRSLGVNLFALLDFCSSAGSRPAKIAPNFIITGKTQGWAARQFPKRQWIVNEPWLFSPYSPGYARVFTNALSLQALGNRHEARQVTHKLPQYRLFGGRPRHTYQRNTKTSFSCGQRRTNASSRTWSSRPSWLGSLCKSSLWGWRGRRSPPCGLKTRRGSGGRTLLCGWAGNVSWDEPFKREQNSLSDMPMQSLSHNPK